MLAFCRRKILATPDPRLSTVCGISVEANNHGRTACDHDGSAHDSLAQAAGSRSQGVTQGQSLACGPGAALPSLHRPQSGGVQLAAGDGWCVQTEVGATEKNVVARARTRVSGVSILEMARRSALSWRVGYVGKSID